MGAQNSFCRQLRPELLRLGEHIILHQPFRLVRVAGDQQRFAELVVLWPSSSSTELLVLQYAYRISTVPCFVAFVATDDYSPGWEVNTSCECWGGCQVLDPAFPKSVLNNSPMNSRQTCTMKTSASCDLNGEGLAEPSLLSSGQ